MPKSRQHVGQAKRNTAVADYIHQGGAHLEWVAVALFYAALHRVDSFLALLNLHPTDHRTRQQYVRDLISDAADEYREMEDGSREARYECRRFADAELNDLRDALSTIEGTVNRLGGSKLKAASE